MRLELAVAMSAASCLVIGIASADESAESSWTRAPYSAVLPDRWTAIAFTNAGRVVGVGDIIPDRLTVGPAPGNDAPPQSGDALSLIDEEMRWLIDFDAAVKVGMALRLGG